MPWRALALLAVAIGPGPRLGPGRLPVCSNSVIVEVVKRTGCALGDQRCWNRAGGFCNDWVDERIKAAGGGATAQLGPVSPADVERGDVAVFESRAHFAYVEAVLRDRRGRPVAVDLSEYNFGSCWVDRNAMVTDLYKVVHRRSGVPIHEVDGGFLRARRDGR